MKTSFRERSGNQPTSLQASATDTKKKSQPLKVALAATVEDSTAEIMSDLLSTSEFICRKFVFGLKTVGQAWTGKGCDGFEPDVVVLVVAAMSDGERQNLFALVSAAFPGSVILAVPACVDGFDAVEVLQLGASDFLLPPLRMHELRPRLMRLAAIKRPRDALVQNLKEKIGLGQIIGESPKLLAEIQRLPSFARSDATVLIAGESGTGKEVFARALHYLSPRSGHAFVPVNCGALPELLMESEIFGHKRGAFTGASSDQPGLVQGAEGGTLFLDEIDALSRSAQVKLLRFLQEGEYRVVGAQQILRANVRVVAAANVDLCRLVREGSFREDLFYRLSVLPLKLPPLRDRYGDVLLLARHFLDRQAILDGAPAKNLSTNSVKALLAYSWPGNVRELQNALTRACVLCSEITLEPHHFDLPGLTVSEPDESFHAMKIRAVQKFERDFLETALRVSGGNVTRAASAVKKNRRAFWELLRKHGLLEQVKRR